MTLLSPQTIAAPSDLGLNDLRELMRTFNETTEQLQSTHSALQHQVARLQGELAEANDQLRRSRDLAALGEIAAGIAHEIRNPLGSIQLYAQMLGDDLSARPEQLDLCRRIERAVSSLDAIIGDVLRFARDADVRPRLTGAGRLLRDAVESCEGLIEEAGIRARRTAARNLRVRVDRPLMVQALGNLIRNAVEAMTGAAPDAPADAPADAPDAASRPARELSLSATRRLVRGPDGARSPRVVLAVADTGPGLPEGAIERMFNPFFTTRATGTGLGLAIVHRIVEAHGGRVSAGNRPEGGARVELYLPPPFCEGDS